jgi:peroxiredoxin
MRAVTLGSWSLLALFFGLAALGPGEWGPPAASADDKKGELKAGEAAPEIEGKDLDGKDRKLSDYRGKVVLLAFWFRSCGPCLADVPRYRALLERHKGKPFMVLGVNSDDDREAAQKAAAKEHVTWPSFWDGANGPVVKRWQVDAWPAVYLLDQKGVIRYGPDHLRRVSVREGPDGKLVQFEYLDDAVNHLLEPALEK